MFTFNTKVSFESYSAGHLPVISPLNSRCLLYLQINNIFWIFLPYSSDLFASVKNTKLHTKFQNSKLHRIGRSNKNNTKIAIIKYKNHSPKEIIYLKKKGIK